MLLRGLPLLLALALVTAGCGSKSSTGGGLGDALQYVPKDATVVIAVDTNPDGDQWQQVDALIGKFPFGGQVKQQLKSSFTARYGLDYDKDVKPVLGNDFVVALTGVPRGGGATPFVVAWKVDDEDAARKLAEQDTTKGADIEGAEIYRGNGGGSILALKDGAFVAARTESDLRAALERASGGDHLTEEDFNAALGDLDRDALVRVTGDFQALLSDPAAAGARKVKWVNALRTYGFTLAAADDGIEFAFNVETAGGLTEKDLPLASGTAAAPVIRRAGEVGIGIRNPAQLYRFATSAVQITNPAGYAKFQRDQATIGKQLGVDIDRDLIGQLSGNASVSVALNGDFALRADLRDPAAAVTTLKKVVPRLKKVAAKRGKSVGVIAPKNGKGFYAVATPDGKKIAFGVVGKSFVLATDAARAAQFAGESPSVVPGAKGALVTASDARALANEIAKQQGQGVAAQVVTGALGDLIGSMETETDRLSGSLKLFVK